MRGRGGRKSKNPWSNSNALRLIECAKLCTKLLSCNPFHTSTIARIFPHARYPTLSCSSVSPHALAAWPMTGGRFRVQRGRRQLDMPLQVRCGRRHGEGQEGVS